MKLATPGIGLIGALACVLAGSAMPARASFVDWIATDEGTLELGHTRLIGQQSYRLASDEIVHGDVYVSAVERAVVDGVIEGDLFLAVMGPADIGGRIEQDLSIASLGPATVEGEVGDDLRVATLGQARIGSVVAGDVLVTARDVELRPPAAIAGALIASGTTVSLAGAVDGPVRITAGKVELLGRIGGDVTVRCDELLLGESAHIVGDLVYDARNDVVPPPGVVDGEVTRTALGRERGPGREALARFEMPKLGPLFDAYLAAVALVAGTILLMVFGPLADHAVAQGSTLAGLLTSFGIGLVALLVMLVLGIVCVFALPFSLAVWSALGALVYFGGLLGKILFGCLLLRPLLRRRCHPLLSLVVGVLATFLVCLIPVVGDLAWIVITLTGMGATLIALRQVGPRPPEEAQAPFTGGTGAPPPVPAAQ